MATLGLYILLTSSTNRLPILCSLAALLVEALYMILVFVLLDVVHGFELVLASVGGHLVALIVVGGAGAWIARSACSTEQVLLLEEVLVIRSLRALQHDRDHEARTRSAPSVSQLAIASTRIALMLKRFHSRVSSRRTSELQQWVEAPERRWLSVLVSVLILASAVFLVGSPLIICESDARQWHWLSMRQ